MGLDRVGGLAIHIILSKLGPTDTASVACVSKRFRVWASDDSIWSTFCAQELDLFSPESPLGNPSPSFKAAYQAWREAYGMYPWYLVRRVKRCWGRIRNWLTVNFPEAMHTLCKGASEDEIKELETCLKVKLPLPTRVLYRFCDGQELTSEEFSGSMLGSSWGLIGGYSFSDYLVNVFLLPLKQTVNSMLALGIFQLMEKSFPVPSELIHSVHDSRGTCQQDAMLLCLEEHVQRLETGIIKLREEGNIRSLSLFPEQPPICSSAVTNGVQVRASAVFVPEFSGLQHESEKFLYAYSICMSLVPEGCVVNGIPFSSCQLYWRHWIIRVNDTVVSDINGEAVIGKFPLLHPGEKEFVYESCTTSASSPGSIEGSFTFVPGRLADPKGSAFEVEVARFPLQMPDYIF